MGDLKRKIAVLPNSPGVYLFKDARERIIYVGKAASLRKRTSSYLRQHTGENPRLAQLRSRINDIDFIVTANEVEALILEANLIKRYRPAYNIDFRDDKTYPYMVICIDDTYPRVMFDRGQRRKNAVYYGPFAHAGAVRESIETLRKIFPFRACRGREPGKHGSGPCLDYHIGICSGPCADAISPEDYNDIIKAVREFMDGRHQEILLELEARMRDESSRQEYELAARTRDRLLAVKRMLERQQAHSLKAWDQDIFSVYQSELDACVTAFFVRGGKILGKRDFFSELPDKKDGGEILSAFLPQFYSRSTQIPKEILLSHPLVDADKELLEKWLAEKANHKVNMAVPVKGKKKELVERVAENAHHALEVHLAKQASDLGWISRAVNGLHVGLSLNRVPYRIECYDISNLGSEDAVGSMVVYEGGIPSRKDFRRFRIKGVEGQNDVAMIREVLSRRLSKLSDLPSQVKEMQGLASEHLESFHKMPDLILIDGGEAQLAVAVGELHRKGFMDINVAALAKKLEEVYLPGMRRAIYLPRDSEALHLLQRIRDEAHRYALDYHHLQRGKRTRRSALDDIHGIGPKRKRFLLRHYGSLAGIAGASLEELRGLSFLDSKTAENVFNNFHAIVTSDTNGQSH
jgi:excinuclease ABC subunit C